MADANMTNTNMTGKSLPELPIEAPENLLSACESAVALLPDAERKEAERVAAEVAAKIASNPMLDIYRRMAARDPFKYYSDEDESPPPSPKKKKVDKIDTAKAIKEGQTPHESLTPSTTGICSPVDQGPEIPHPVPWPVDPNSPIKLFHAGREKPAQRPAVLLGDHKFSERGAESPAPISSAVSSPPDSLGRRRAATNSRDLYPVGMSMMEGLNLGPDYGPLQRPSLQTALTAPSAKMPEVRRRRPTLAQAVSSAFTPNPSKEPVQHGTASKNRAASPRRPSVPAVMSSMASAHQGNTKFEPRRPHDNTSLFYMSSSRQDLAHIPPIRPGPRPSLANVFSAPEVPTSEQNDTPFSHRRPSLADMMTGHSMTEVHSPNTLPAKLAIDTSFGTVSSDRTSASIGEYSEPRTHIRSQSDPTVGERGTDRAETPTRGNAFSDDFWTSMGLMKATNQNHPFPKLTTTGHPESIKAYSFVCGLIEYFWTQEKFYPLPSTTETPKSQRSSASKRSIIKSKLRLSSEKDVPASAGDSEDMNVLSKLPSLPKPAAHKDEPVTKPVLDQNWHRARVICECVLNAARERISNPAHGYEDIEEYIKYKPAYHTVRLEVLEVQDERDVEQYASKQDFEELKTAQAMLQRLKNDDEYKVPDQGWELVWATKFYEWAVEKEETEQQIYEEKLEKYNAIKNLNEPMVPLDESETEDEEEIEWKEWLAETRKFLKYEPKKNASDAEQSPQSTVNVPSPTVHEWKERRRERRRARLTEQDVEDWDAEMTKGIEKERERQLTEAAQRHVRHVSRHSA